MVDVHVHVYPPEVVRGAEEIGRREGYFALLTSSSVHRFASAEEVVSYVRSSSLSRAFVFGFAFRDQGLCRLCNDYVAQAASLHPELVPLAVVNPLARGALAEIERCREMGFRGVGELFPDGQGFDVSDLRQTFRWAGALEEMGMFLLLHASEPAGHSYPGKGSTTPDKAFAFAKNHPGLTVVWAHLGGGLFLYEGMPEARRFLGRSYYDTAASVFLYDGEVLESALRLAPGKVLFGSDFPIADLGRFRSRYGEGLLRELLDPSRAGTFLASAGL